ncbi:MAG TPA: hypothetical protein VNR39_11785, partial [Pseudolabrys sp.]|nr:hypothetical protein [Pseudolabrys sp.]
RNDTAMERRGAQVLRVMENRAPQGAIHKERLAALHPLGVSEGRKREGRPPRAFENRGDQSRPLFDN